RDYAAEYLDSAPTIEVSEVFGKPYCPTRFDFEVELLDASKRPIASWDGSGLTGSECAWDGWNETIEHKFTGYGPGVRYVHWKDGGTDTVYWAGHYGATLSSPRLLVGLK